MSKPYPTTLIGLDIEATDLSPVKGEIIEVGAVKYRGGQEVDSWHSMVKPSKPIPAIIKSITGIDDKMVAKAPKIDEIKEGLAKFIDDFPIVGHNIKFDIDYLRQNGVELSNNVPYDTWRLSTIVYQGMRSFSLEALTARLGLEHKEKHRAIDDAKAGIDLFFHLVDKLQQIDYPLLQEITKISQRTEWPLREVFEEILELVPASQTKANKKLKSVKKTDVEEQINFTAAKIPRLLEQGGTAEVKISGYEYRPPQVAMMKYVADAFAKAEWRLIETPPGVGKSMAYLLPAVTFARAKQEPVVISTYTRSLQDQLAQKDIPTVAEIVPFSFKTAVLKGRQQYLCRRLFDKLKGRAQLSDDEMTTIAKLLVWLQQTDSGEFDELALTREDFETVRRITSDHHACQGKQCPHRQECFVDLARRRAKMSDIVIVNHALLLNEPMLENEPVLETKRLIIDEAHELEEAATDAYSRLLTKEMIDEWLSSLSDKRRKGGVLDIFPRRKYPQVLGQVQEMQQNVVLLSNDIALFFGLVGMFAKRYQEGGQYKTFEVSLNEDLRHQTEWQRVEESAQNMINKLGSQITGLEELADRLSQEKKLPRETRELVGDLKAQCQDGENLQNLFREMFLEPKEDQVYWITIRREEKFTIKAAPVRVSDRLQEDLYKDKDTVILTSATLSTAMPSENGRFSASFDYFKDRLGLIDFEFSRVANVFDYKKQALIYFPQDIAGPKSPEYTEQLAKITEDIARKIGGKTLVLFTSYSGIKSVYEKVSGKLKKAKIDVLAQGVTGGKMKLLQQFQQSDRAVLLGTATFWQGVDIPGDKLSCVIMAKLPFNVPSEPVFKARQNLYENGFTDYAVPLAILRFRQGFGRLIRTKKDRGVMLIMDNRVEKANYGLMFLRSLPECEVRYGQLAEAASVTADWVRKKTD
ncbi:helicase C-terminal domain-containing protein [Patescibacteria group bacterium]